MKQSREAKEACNERLKEILKATKQQIDALYPSPATTPTADTIEEEDDDEKNRRVQPQHFLFLSPETTRSQSGSLQLSPCHQSCLLPHLGLFYRQLLSRITNIAQQSADRRRGRKHERYCTMDSKAASTKRFRHGAVTACSWRVDAGTLAGIAVVTGGIGLIMGLASRSSSKFALFYITYANSITTLAS
jgi:hypothetical protein